MTSLRRAGVLLPFLTSLALLLGSTLPAHAWPQPVGQSESITGRWNVADFGARCNGQGDDYAAFVNAFTSANTTGAAQALVDVPSGNCLIGTTVSIPASIKLEGQGPSSTLTAATGLSGPVLANASSAGNITIANLQINGSRATAASATNCISITSASDIQISSVTTHACRGDGIALAGVTRGTVGAATSYGNTGNGINVSGASVGVRITSPVVYDNATGAKSNASGIAVGGTSLGTLITNPVSYDDQGGSATQAYGVTESGSANYTKVAAFYATGNVSGTTNLIGANSQVLDSGSYVNPTVSGPCVTTAGVMGFASNYLCYGNGTAAANVPGINIANSWSAAQTYTAAGSLDMSAGNSVSALRVPSAAGASPTADGRVAFDTTGHNLVAGYNGTTATLAATNIAQTWSAAQTFNSSGVLDLSAASVTAGFKLPSSAGAAPTADGFCAFDTTAHAPKCGFNGTSRQLATLNGTETLSGKSITFDQITAATNNASLTYTGTWNGSGANTASTILPQGAGSAPTTDGVCTWNTTTHTPSCGFNGTNRQLASLTGTETLSGKTLTTPVISTITNTGTLTLPTATTTLVGTGTSDALTNKTFDQTSGIPVRLATNTLGGSATNITFSSISASYKTLEIDCQTRGDGATTGEGINMQFNGDTATNYDGSGNRVNNAANTALVNNGGTSLQIGIQPGTSVTRANIAAATHVTIPNYAATTFEKSFTATGASIDSTAANLWSGVWGGSWRSTAAINAIKIFPNTSTNFVTGSYCELWGRP